MNIIAIDPSLKCTAMVVNDKKFAYVNHSTMYTKKNKMVEWFASVEKLLTYRPHQEIPKLEHSELELFKLGHYADIVSAIIADILDNIDITLPTKIGIEGYSYSSAAGPLIDLVTFSTLLRTDLLSHIPNSTLEIYPPTTLKLKAAQLTYPATPKNKKGTVLEWRNNEGVSGGSFKKHDIYKSLIDNSSITCEWVGMLRDKSKLILNSKNIPKPIEDINDAKILYEIIKSNK